MKRFLPLSIEDLNMLLTNQSVVKGIALVKPGSQRHACKIDDCLWQGTDYSELDNHVHTCHESDLEPKGYVLQIVISEDECENLLFGGWLFSKALRSRLCSRLRSVTA